MNPTDFAWSTLQSITQLQPKNVKLLVDEIEYPTLGTDSSGYVIHLSIPRKPRDNVYSLHGMYFDNDANGKSSMWRMYRASVYHMSMHANTTDYRVYRSLQNYSPSVNNLMFAISLVEDYSIRGHMRARWPGLLLDCAYAGHMTSMRFKSPDDLADPSMRLAANFLSYSLVGKPLMTLGSDLDRQVSAIHEYLIDLEDAVQKYYSHASFSQGELSTEEERQEAEFANPVLGIDSKKINGAKKVLNVFSGQSCYMTQVPSPPFADNHGPNDLFESAPAAGETAHFDSILTDAAKEYALNLSPSVLAESEKQLSIESQTVLGDWEYSLTVMKRLADMHRSADPKTHFENFLFPKEDYAEYVRTRAQLIGPIRLVLDQLRNVKSALEENVRESGQLDVSKAIQVVATESGRNDVFQQEEIDSKSESWAIVIDSSKSLETFAREVQEIAVCLAEVAKDLIPSHNSWACYSFNENLYIIKDFSEIYGMRTKSRIGGLESGLKTFLPDALRIAASRLKNTTQEIKVILVASDGFPLGYEGIDEELVETIQQINRANIQLIGMGVGSSSIKKYFRSNCQISSPYDLMKQFVKIYVELSAGF